MWRMMLAAMLISSGLLLAGCGGDDAVAEPDHTAKVAAQRIAYELRDGNHMHYWERLHPDHQELVRQGQFDACYRYTRPDFTEVGQPGMSMDWPDDTYGHVYGVMISTGGGQWVNRDVSMQLTAVDGEWRILLSDTELEAFNHLDCPSLWPSM